MGKEFDRSSGQPSVRKPKTAQFKVTTRRLRDRREARLAHRPSLEWHLDQERVCQAYGDVVDYVGLDELKATLIKSRVGEELLNGPSGENLEIYYDPQVVASQFYARDGRKVITLNPHRPRADLLLLFATELRASWQHHQGALANPLGYEPEQAVLVNRAQQADRQVTAIRVAWELKLAGENDAWDYLLVTPAAELARAFEARAQSDFRSLNNGDAARVAYDLSFEQGRTRQNDKRLIHQMLLDETSALKRSNQKPESPAQLLVRLGEMPFGRNYLTMADRRAPADESYAAIEDRSNANFLWFIKFERSFQEKEQEMVQESLRLSAEIVDFSKHMQARRTLAAPGPR